MAAVSRTIRVRYRRFARLRKLGNALKAMLTAEGTRLSASATGRVFTVNAGTDVCTSVAHGFASGKGPLVLSNSGGALPAGLAALTSYWPIVIDADTFKLALTYRKAAAGTAVDITGAGTGTQTAKYQSTAAGFMERFRTGLRPRTLRAASDIDTLP